MAQRTADGSVVFTAPSPTALAVQRAPDPAPVTTDPEFAPSPVSDGSDAADSASAAPDPGGPAATTTSKPADPAQKPDAEGAAQHVDDALVRALFPRLSRLLKDELRRDRERAGFLINTRH